MMKLLSRSTYVKGLRPSVVFFDSSDGKAIIDEEVTVEIDLMSFAPLNSYRGGGIEEDPLFDREEFTLTISTLADMEERIELIKEYHRPLRTGSIQITQQVNGPPELQLRAAVDKSLNLLELLSFLQGVHSTPIRAEVVSVAGKDQGFECEKWVSNYKKSIGIAFKGERLSMGGETARFLDDAYDDYVNELRDKYRIHMVFGWYLDALLGVRSIDSQFASICSGIELLAKRHSDLSLKHKKTKPRIVHLVKKLDVEVRDLAEFSDSYEDTKLDDDNYANEYFYHKTRQYVMHGDNLDTTSDELFKDYIAGLRLFQRLLRNQLIGTERLDKYSKLNDLKAEDTRYTQ